MEFNLEKSLQILERTPLILEQMLSGLSADWIMNNEGEDTWSPFDIMGHLLHGEKTDWTARTKKILAEGGDKKFVPFDRLAQFNESKGKSIDDLLTEFKEARNENLTFIRSLGINELMLDKRGIHPSFGEVTLSQLLSTWTVHDLAHLAQIARVMAKQYKEAVGPWLEYFRVLK